MAISYYATGSIASSTSQVFNGLFGSTSLYRTVDSGEFTDIKKTGLFRQGSNSMVGKFFAKTKKGATTWGKGWGQSNYVEIKLSKNALKHSSITPFKYLDAIDDAYYFSDLDYLNSIIKAIRFF